jgi:ankyrin repeat protein
MSLNLSRIPQFLVADRQPHESYNRKKPKRQKRRPDLERSNRNRLRKTSPGSHLTAAAKISPLEVTRHLIEHGAQVRRSGALQAAVEANRVEVLEILVEHGADLNERHQKPLLHSNDPRKIEQHLSETPLHIAVREKAYEAAAWLLKHDASRTIQDSHHQSPDDLVALGGDAKLLEIFRL